MLSYLLANIVISFWLFDYCLDSDIRGKYYHVVTPYIESRIEVCLNDSKENIKFYVLHELWHFFRYEFISEEEKKFYEFLFNWSNNLDFYREYGKSSAEEDFADNFALAIDSFSLENKINSRVLKLKINFIKHLLIKYEKTYKN